MLSSRNVSGSSLGFARSNDFADSKIGSSKHRSSRISGSSLGFARSNDFADSKIGSSKHRSSRISGSSLGFARTAGGFTLLEVMIAVAIMSVGATSLLALQSANTIANAQAHNVSRATMANQLWAQRLRRDSLEWRDPSPAGLAATTYLQDASALGEEDATDWIVPSVATTNAVIAAESFAFDFRGREVPIDSTDPPVHFCTNIRLRWVMKQNALRADIRTWWPRLSPTGSSQMASTMGAEGMPNCSDAANTVDTELNAAERVRAVYGTVLLRPAPL